MPALGQFLGSAAGLSAPVITRLTETWKAEQRIFAARDLSGVDYVYLWADGIHVNIRLEEHKLCLLVMIGVRADGRKELIALADGYRESTESRADLLRDCARRGMRAPVLAAGDGALGFWGALREVFPETAEQRCWFHRNRKESTCRRAARCSGGEEVGRRAVAGRCSAGNMALLLKERESLPDHVADGRPADVTNGIGEDVQGAQSSVVENGEQDAFAVADLLREDAGPGTGLAWAAAPLVSEAFGLGGLPEGEPRGQFAQFVLGESGQCWVG